ncbi:MAG: NAD(P)-binding domain-containing protein, partial [Acidobacteriota bacterium]|nr:NAD(P)-binding domain-containing protein [Acidobacteriota bacterium]MDQ2979453.1 NAD(P)-binding domain-containing protein [Acidobacteriota bacterium]
GANRAPAHDPDTLESNVPGIYLAGALLGGAEVGRIFIENSRHHAARIAEAIERRLRPAGAASRPPGEAFPPFRETPGNDPER